VSYNDLTDIPTDSSDESIAWSDDEIADVSSITEAILAKLMVLVPDSGSTGWADKRLPLSLILEVSKSLSDIGLNPSSLSMTVNNQNVFVNPIKRTVELSAKITKGTGSVAAGTALPVFTIATSSAYKPAYHQAGTMSINGAFLRNLDITPTAITITAGTGAIAANADIAIYAKWFY
jgi:hypothetical protein